jgi:hypothetical protein
MPYAVAPVPGRITAALQFIQHAQLVMWGPCVQTLAGEEWKAKAAGRKLSEVEMVTYETALGALIEYFDSSDDAEEPAPTSPSAVPGGDSVPIKPALN